MLRRFDGDTVAKRDKLTGIGGDSFAWNDNADQIQRVGGRERDEFARQGLVALRTQRVYGHAQSKLLSEETADETAAANFAAILKAAQSDQELPPVGEIGFAREEFAKDNSVAAKKHPASGFEGARAIVGFTGKEQRPAACTVTRTRGSSDSLPRATLGIDQCAKIIETVRGEKAGGYEFPERRFHFGF